jgi:hypothetical protein
MSFHLVCQPRCRDVSSNSVGQAERNRCIPTTKYESVRALDFEVPCHFIGWHRTYLRGEVGYVFPAQPTPFVGRRRVTQSYLYLKIKTSQTAFTLDKASPPEDDTSLYIICWWPSDLLRTWAPIIRRRQNKSSKLSHHRSKRLLGAGSTSSSNP